MLRPNYHIKPCTYTPLFNSHRPFPVRQLEVRSLLEIPYSIWKFSDGHYWFRHRWQLLIKTKQGNHLAGVSKLIISWDKFARRGPQDSGDLQSWSSFWWESVILSNLSLLQQDVHAPRKDCKGSLRSLGKKRPCSTFHLLWQRGTDLFALSVVIFSVIGRMKIHKVEGIHSMEEAEEKERQEKRRIRYVRHSHLSDFHRNVFCGKIPTMRSKIQPQDLKARSHKD